MFRFFVLIVSMVWASLLLFSWSGADDSRYPLSTAIAVEQGSASAGR